MDIRLINTHSHVNMLKTINPAEAVSSAKNDGIVIIVPSSSSNDIFEVDDFVKRYDNVYGYVGVFPEEVKDFSEKTLLNMEKIIKTNKRIVGIGEIGLDYYWDRSYIDLQKNVFIKQIEFANQMNLPLNIHSREANEDTYNILKKYNKNSTAILHCFSGDLDFAYKCIDNGIYISIGGIITFKNAKNTHEVAKNIPLQWLLLETDDPYLTPVPYRGEENQPKYIDYILKEIAKLRDISEVELAEITTKNAERIFKLNAE